MQSPLTVTAGAVVTAPAAAGERRVMAKRGPHSFKKWQGEIKRKRKAQEKMARRQGNKNQVDDADNPGPAVGNVEGLKGDAE